MKFKRFKDLNLFVKIANITVISSVLLVASVYFFIVPLIEEDIIKERRDGLENVTNLAYSLMQDYERLAQEKKISLEDARANARENIKALRYGVDRAEYLFIVQSTDCTAVMHPIKPSLDGTDLSRIQDEAGKYLFAEMVEIATSKTAGFIDYSWPKPGSEEAVQKLSHVRIYEPWGWVVGTGVYIDDIQAKIGAIKTKIYIAILTTILISLALTALIARKVSTPVKMGVGFAEKIAKGDLTSILDINQKDEVGTLANSLNYMVQTLKSMFSELAENADVLSSSSTELAAISNQLNTSASQTTGKVSTISVAIESVNSGINSISASVEQSLTGVNEVAASAGEMTGTIREISQNTEKANATTRHAVESIEETLTTIRELGVSASEIDKVTDTIYEISEQTNLLALNATIEAARAGQAGKGFAVVADEIKALAMQTTGATGEIDKKIKDMQRNTENAVARIREIHGVIHELNDIVTLVSGALVEQSASTDGIASSTVQVQQGLRQISENLALLVESADNIASDIENVNTNTGETAEGSKQVNISAENMSEMSSVLGQAINRFQFT